MDAAAAVHIIPFAMWLGILLLAQMMHLTPGSGTEEIKSLNLLSDASLYAVRTGLCFLVFLCLRPWRYYGALRKKHILPAALTGAAVFVLWTVFEWEIVRQTLPSLHELYEKWCVWPIGEMREPPASPPPYAPDVCGWPLTVVRLIGSAFVISVIEEFFWRGYAIRTARTPDFLDIDIGELHWPTFLLVSVLFAAEHVEFAAGFVTGLIYGIFYIKTRDVWAASIAHITTNALLGIYVIATGSWQFW